MDNITKQQLNIINPTHYKAETFRDERGHLCFFNNLSLENFKRIYFISHPDTSIVRAWQGYQKEAKLFKVINGSFVLAYVRLNNLQTTSDNLLADHVILKADKNEFLYIPPGYANGLKALEENSTIQVLSSMKLEDSLKDKVRFEPNQWFDWNKY